MAVTAEEWAEFRKKVTAQLSKINEGCEDFEIALDANTPDTLEWVATESAELATECRSLLEKI